jgi:hypothetical protein
MVCVSLWHAQYYNLSGITNSGFMTSVGIELGIFHPVASFMLEVEGYRTLYLKHTEGNQPYDGHPDKPH